MKKKIWILNHYATRMYRTGGGRHYNFSRHLLENGYEPTIFCATTFHNREKSIELNGGIFRKNYLNNIPFVFVKATEYKNNGFNRVMNILSFYKNLKKTLREYSKKNGKPDVIMASSVHPLTLVAGIQIAKEFDVPCICEIRDLWPESIVAYDVMKESNIIIQALYKLEKWIYKNADTVIMTWEGVKDYIVDKGWEKHIDLEKFEYITNGVILKDFNSNSTEFTICDDDLLNQNYKNIVYTGSIRKVNNLDLIVDVAKDIQNKGHNHIKFLIYGDGLEKENCITRCQDENINNIVFKGKIEKKYIPYVIKNSDINLLHNTSTSLNKYGQSQNKLFEYLAAGKCIIQTYKSGYNILEQYDCGVTVDNQNVNSISDAIVNACNDEEACKEYGQKARKISEMFDFEVHTKKLIDIIERV